MSPQQPLYDAIGRTYAATRRPDPRFQAAVRGALGDARSVVNVGAGTGSYEPDDLLVVAVEPSEVMIRQRPHGSTPAVQAVAEHLPFRNGAFDAAMVTFSMHHWSDPVAGLAELRRVSRSRVVILTTDPDVWERQWLLSYFPAIGDLDRRRLPPIKTLVRALGGRCSVRPVPVPHDCSDGFTAAYWRRPDAYLDPAVRANISTFELITEQERSDGIEKLATDLRIGEWQARFGELMTLDELDAGQRLVVSEF